MKKLEENNEEIKKSLLNELYDIENLKNDLDEILNIEDITVSESLIQATLKRAKEEEQSKQLILSKQPIENKQPLENKQLTQKKELTRSKQSTRSKKGVPFHYGMVAACACILLVAGISLIANPPVSRKDSTSEMSTQDESYADSSTAMEDMESTETTETSKDDTDEGSVSGETKNDSTNSVGNTEEAKEVPSFFDIAKEDNTSYIVLIGEIGEIIIYDENGLVISNITDTPDIESIYNAFSKVGNENHIEEVQNEKQEGQYVRQYDIIAQENSEWSELHIWISNVDEETSIITRQLITSDGEVITHRITDVNSEIVLNIINTVP